MNRRSIPIFLFALLSACAQIYSAGGDRGGPPETAGSTTNDRHGTATATTSITDQQQVLLRETAADLKLTPRQLVLWERYQEKVGALMTDQLRPESSSARRQSALQQIDVRVTTVRHRLAAIEEVQDAAITVYESLDAGQKAIADLRLAATVPALYSGLISCVTVDTSRDKPGSGAGPSGAPPRR